MTTLTQEPATEGQIEQISNVASAAARKAVVGYFKGVTVSKEGAQRVHGNADFAVRVREATILALTELSVTDRFRDEEVASTYGYLSGYRKPKGITEQTNILRQLFPGIGFANEVLAQAEIPNNAEGGFAIPKWQSLAPTYGEALQKVLGKLSEVRGGRFYNCRAGQLGPERLRQTAKTIAAFEQLAAAQPDHDILVVAAQFGLRHRGRSVRRAREVFTSGEFGLGAFAVAVMLLTHADRLQHYDDLWLDCAGDEYDDPAAGERFTDAPFFFFSGGWVEFGTHWFGRADDSIGSVSGFVPPA